MKIALTIVAVAAVIVILIIATILISLDSIIERGIETAGSASLGTDVVLSDADLSLLTGRVSLADLKIANPAGFETDHLFRLGRAQVMVKPTALLQDEIVVEHVILDSPSLIIEQSLSGSNLSVVLGNIKRTTAPKEEPEKKEPEPAEPKAEKTFRIKLLHIKGAEVTFASVLTGSQPIKVPLPEIRRENISNADGTGMQLAQIVEEVLVEMMQTGLTEGKGKVPMDVLNDVRGDLDDLAPELAGTVSDQAEELLEKTTGALKGLFKKE